MKKLFFILAVGAGIGFSQVATAQATITVYGRNTGTTVITTPDGTSTATINCDNWYRDICYTLGPVKLQSPRYHQLFAYDVFQNPILVAEGNIVNESHMISGNGEKHTYTFDNK